MDDEFLEDEFVIKLIKLGAQEKHLRMPVREILQKIDKERQEDEEE